jgi:segregation and condensation protein A
MAEETVRTVQGEEEQTAAAATAGPSTAPLAMKPANGSAQDDSGIVERGIATAVGDAEKVVEESVAAEPFALEPRPIAAPLPEAKRPSAAKEEASQSPFSVTVGQVYDGPFDLLLDLIRKQNIDIYDIPIARITAQFLEYTHHLKQTDVDAAGEFIYMASLLIHIKSRTMLPRDPSGTGAEGDSEDPRRELVERLLEHERFKAAAQMLMQKQQIEEATWSNPGIREFREDAGAEREIAADTVDLVRVFQDILQRMRSRPVLNVDEESVTVAQMIEYVKRRLVMEDKPVSLRRLLHATHTERALICMFLAMLELVRLQAVLLHQQVVQGDILIKKTENFDTVFAEQQAARDDWR